MQLTVPTFTAKDAVKAGREVVSSERLVFGVLISLLVGVALQR